MLWAIEQGIPTIEINPGHPDQRKVMFRFRLRAAEVLPALLDAAGYSLDWTATHRLIAAFPSSSPQV